jgi:hypothetical protein
MVNGVRLQRRLGPVVPACCTVTHPFQRVSTGSRRRLHVAIAEVLTFLLAGALGIWTWRTLKRTGAQTMADSMACVFHAHVSEALE